MEERRQFLIRRRREELRRVWVAGLATTPIDRATSNEGNREQRKCHKRSKRGQRHDEPAYVFLIVARRTEIVVVRRTAPEVRAVKYFLPAAVAAVARVEARRVADDGLF